MVVTEEKYASKAAEYMFEPLTGPAPSEETGPGSHFGSTMAPSANLAGSNGTENASAVQVQEHSTGNSTNPFRRDSPTLKSGSSTHAHQVSGGTTGPGIPRREAFPPPRVEAFATYSDDPTQQHRSAEHSRTELPRSGRARGNSLTERFPGDNSVHPLDTIKHENNVARHAPHLNKKHMPGADVVDMLDDATGGRYHHEGPYDAAMLARNTSYESSPLAALKTTNQEALKATPNEKIQDSLRNHRPLDGVAEIPPGSTDEMGRRYNYEEGTDMMIANGGNYGRWPGVEYAKDDFEGRGIPSYSGEIDRSIIREQQREHGGSSSGHGEVIELTDQANKADDTRGSKDSAPSYAEWEEDHEDSKSHGIGGGLKRRIGNLIKKDK